jgi:hypothetical protein
MNNTTTILQDIETEQKKVLQYLTNVNVNGYSSKSYVSSDRKTLYDVDAERKTIWNLDSTTPHYLAFLKFMNVEFAKLYNEFEMNSGAIFTSHLFDTSADSAESAEILENYRKKYETNFKIDPDTIHKDWFSNIYTTLGNEYYPYFETDIMSKTRKLQYEEIERELGITIPIQEQNEFQFLDIMYILIHDRCSKFDCQPSLILFQILNITRKDFLPCKLLHND